MNPEVHHADDSCQVNQTVQPSGLLTTSEKGLPNERSVPSPTPSDSDRQDDGDKDLEEPFPEGGFKAWLVVFGSFCTMLSVYGLINSSAVFESYFATHQLADSDSSTIGWIFSLYLFVVFFAGIQVGPIFDRHGPRLLVAVGSVLVVASQMILGFCTGKYGHCRETAIASY